MGDGMREYIPFHDSLRRGAKRGIPRAVRFIYLELVLEARQYGGRIPLPYGLKTPETAMHSLLGGPFKEIKLAFELLTKPVDPDDDTPMIRVEGTDRRWIIIVTAFDRWAKADLSTSRVQRFRQKQIAAIEQHQAVSADETRFTAVSETVSKRLEESREEKSTYVRDRNAADAAPNGASKARAKGTRIPEDWQPSAALLAWAEAEGISEPLGPLAEFRDFWRSVAGQKGVKLDWEATYRNRLRQLVEAGRLEKETPLKIYRSPDRDKYIPKPAKALQEAK
jgi:hypothetical protein